MRPRSSSTRRLEESRGDASAVREGVRKWRGEKPESKRACIVVRERIRGAVLVQSSAIGSRSIVVSAIRGVKKRRNKHTLVESLLCARDIFVPAVPSSSGFQQCLSEFRKYRVMDRAPETWSASITLGSARIGSSNGPSTGDLQPWSPCPLNLRYFGTITRADPCRAKRD